jgi:hypothetical protein
MSSTSAARQLKLNAVALISLFVAITALGYTTYRNERTEYNRNIRVAAFETLKNLGELQILVEYAHFRKNVERGDPVQGNGRLLYLRDLARLLPQPGPRDAERLWIAWRDNSDRLVESEEAMIKITDEIQRLRLSVLELLEHLS